MQKIKLIIPIILGCSSIFIFLNWPQKINRESIVGNYVANHGQGTDVIKVEMDGSYILTCKSKQGKKITNEGRWSFEYRQGEPRLTFHGFIFGIPGYGLAEKSMWDVEVERSWGNMELCIDPDLGYFYQKE